MGGIGRRQPVIERPVPDKRTGLETKVPRRRSGCSARNAAMGKLIECEASIGSIAAVPVFLVRFIRTGRERIMRGADVFSVS
jgi:hypothetical protein